MPSYRTLSLESFEIIENRMEIPDSIGYGGQLDSIGLGPDNRLDTMVIGIDLLNNNAILCYSYKVDESAIYNNIELFNSEKWESIISFNYTCINNVLDIRGSTIIDNSVPEACGTTQVLSLSDLQPAFDLSKYIDSESGQIYWVSSNGNYWQIISNNEIIVINADKQLEARYPLSFSISINLIPGTTLLPAFLIDD